MGFLLVIMKSIFACGTKYPLRENIGSLAIRAEAVENGTAITNILFIGKMTVTKSKLRWMKKGELKLGLVEWSTLLKKV